MKKKVIVGLACGLAAVLCCVLVMVLIAGNLRKKPDETGWLDKALAEIKLDVDNEYEGTLNINISSDESEVASLNAIIKAFNKVYPNIKVNTTPYVMSSYYGKLVDNAGAAFGNNDFSLMSDMFWFAPDFIDLLYDADILFPLSEIMKKDTTFDVKNLVEESVRVSKINDTMYMMPRDFNQVVMYFNEKIFDIAHVAYPTAQMSKQEFMTMLTNLRTGINASTEKNDYGVAYKDACTYLIDVNALWDSWVWPLTKSFGGTVVDSEGKATLNSTATMLALDFWKSLRDRKDVGTLLTPNVGTQFRMQSAPIFFHVRASMSDITKSDQKVKGVQKLGVTALPQFGSQYTVGGGASGYGMYKNAVHKTEAWLFLKFIVSKAGQEAFSATGNCIPVLKSLLKDETSAWRTYSSPALGTAFDNDAFIYGMDFEVKPFATTRDFYQYIPLSVQANVLSCLQVCFSAIDTATSREELAKVLEKQSDQIDYYVQRANR